MSVRIYRIFHLYWCCNKHRYTVSKIALKSDSLTSFGGIFYVMDQFHHIGLDELIDRRLGIRSFLAGYQYSEILSSIFWIYFCGGTCIEDIGTRFGGELAKRPHTRIPSPDTLLRGLKELSVNNTEYTSTEVKVCF